MLVKTVLTKGYGIKNLLVVAGAKNHQSCLGMSTRAHYEQLYTKDTYEDSFFYEDGDYGEHLLRLVRQRLQLEKKAMPHRTLLDIGGGTGYFSKTLIADVDADCVVVDPFLKQIQPEEDAAGKMSFEKVPAEIFMEKATADQEWRSKGFHQVLFKEVIHHFKSKDRPRILRGMYEGLLAIKNAKDERATPSLLIITRPQSEIDYPLWDEARHVWAKSQPSLQEFVDDLESAGFVDVSHTVERYPCVMELERWQKMVKSRVWSTFAEFTDNELDIACESMAAREKDRIKDGNVHFEDRLLFVSARKPS